MVEHRYRSYAAYLRQRYGPGARRLSVDPGLGCPHRASGGCTFCAHAAPAAPLEDQIRRGVARLGGGARPLLLYLQGGTGTNAAPQVLRTLYDRALAMADFRELIVATRPDCVDTERARLLGSYTERGLDVWVELGLQSADDRTLAAIHRGHDATSFSAARRLLGAWGVRVAAHVIHGLPGEGLEEFLRTVRWVAAQDPDGIKIHNLHIQRNTALEGEYLRGEITVPCASAHLEAVARALEYLSPRAVVMRLLTDTPQGDLLAPRAFPDKSRFLRDLDQRMEMDGRRQGARYEGVPQP